MVKYFQPSLVVLLLLAASSSQEHPQIQNLFREIQADNLAAVLDISSQNYFKDKPITSLRNASGWTCLHVAAYFGANSVAKHLIENGADLMAKNQLGETPLHFACQRDHAEMAQQIIEAAEQRQLNITALLEAEQNEHQTPVFYAAKTSFDVVRVLMGKNVSLQHVDIYGMLPMHHAVAHRKMDVRNLLLLGMGKDVPAMQPSGKTISHLVAEHDFIQFLRDSFEEFDISATDALGQTPSCWAARNGSIGYARHLIERSEDILTGQCFFGENNEFNGTTLHVAAYYGRTLYVNLLLEQRVDKMARDSTGGTAIHAMARRSFLTEKEAQDMKDVLELFRGKDVVPIFFETDNRGRTPFLVAAESASLNFSKLLENVIRTNLTVVDIDGYSALHLAASVDFLEWLLSGRFPDINARTFPSKLGDQKPGRLNALMTAIKRRAPIQLLSYLIWKNVNKTAVNDFDQSAVHLAVEENYTEAIDLLNGFSFNFSLRDNRGRTPLIYAIELERNEAALRMLKYLPNKSDNCGDCRLDTLDTPLHIAVMKPSVIEVVKLLVKDAKVNVSGVNAKGETALHKAVAYLNIEAAKVLLANGATSSMTVFDVYKKTPFHWLATWCSATAVEIGKLMIAALPANSSAMRMRDFDDFEPLDIAIRHNCLEMAEIIMAVNSESCQKPNSQGLTPWQQAKTLGYHLMTENLLKKGLCTKPSLQTSCDDALCQAQVRGCYKYFQCGEVPFIDNGFVSEGTTSYSVAKRNISCQSGYRLLGSDVIECNSDFKWIVRSYCEGTERQLSCMANADLVGSSSVKCSSDGKWTYEGHCQATKMTTDCEDIYLRDSNLPSGVYTIYSPDRPPVAVYCDMTYLGGGWTVFQRRVDGSQDFFLKWADYKKGIGNLSANFWLGNDNIHAITSGQYEYNLLIALTANNGATGYALYDGFRMEDEANGFALRYKSFKENGGIGDSLRPHKDMKFSTVDSDNDVDSSRNCANLFKGGWWYGDCHWSNLNGVYGRPSAEGVTWNTFYGSESMKATALMIRRSSLS